VAAGGVADVQLGVAAYGVCAEAAGRGDGWDAEEVDDLPATSAWKERVVHDTVSGVQAGIE
jgi:hypothetical protein